MTPPVLSVRDERDRAVAARVIASGAPVAFYIGLFVVVKLLRPAWREADGGLFWRVKPGRPEWSKLPMLALPRHSVLLVDRAALHPEVRHLARRPRWEHLWRDVGAPLHVIAPMRRPARHVHPALVTTPDDAVAVAPDRQVSSTTAAFFWFDDPAWQDLAERAARAAPPHTYLGGTSFNEHGVQPPYTLEELQRSTPKEPVVAVVHDPVLERAGVFSSHTMVRLPLVGEEPSLVITREGSVGAAWVEDALGLPVRRLASTASASRRPGTTAEEIEARARTLRGAA